MTTTVIVRPAGHRVLIVSLPKGGEIAHSPDYTLLDPGSPERTFYVHSGKDLEIREVAGDVDLDTAIDDAMLAQTMGDEDFRKALAFLVKRASDKNVSDGVIVLALEEMKTRILAEIIRD